MYCVYNTARVDKIKYVRYFFSRRVVTIRLFTPHGEALSSYLCSRPPVRHDNASYLYCIGRAMTTNVSSAKRYFVVHAETGSPRRMLRGPTQKECIRRPWIDLILFWHLNRSIGRIILRTRLRSRAFVNNIVFVRVRGSNDRVVLVEFAIETQVVAVRNGLSLDHVCFRVYSRKLSRRRCPIDSTTMIFDRNNCAEMFIRGSTNLLT